MSQTSPGTPPGTPGNTDPDGLAMPRRAVAALAVIAAVVLVVLDGAIANVALPTIVHSLGVDPATAIWTVTGYQLAIVMVLLPAGLLGERFSYRRLFAGGVLLFTVASALCALSPSLPWLIAARFLQGLGAAPVMALGVALLRFVYPRRLLGSAIGWNALAIALAAAAGPVIGGVILSVASWPWLFAVNLPIGALVLFATRGLPVVPPAARRLDPVSIALNAGAFGALVLGADLVVTRPGRAAGLLALGILAAAVLVRRERPRPAPLIPLDLLAGRSFRLSAVSSVFCFAGQMAGLVALPFHLQHGLGEGPVMTGLCLTPWPLAVALAAPLSGRAAERLPTAWLCAGGGACLALGLALAAIWPPAAGPLPLAAFAALCGLGFGFFQTPNNRNMLLSAPPARSGAAGGAQGTARLTGQTLGAVAMSLLFGALAADLAPRIGLGLGAAAALAAALTSLLRTAPAKATATAVTTQGCAEADR